MNLRAIRALTFDVYGTLIDWETGIVGALRPLTDRLATELSRDEILEAHARHESAQQRWTPTKPYREVLAIVYRRLAETWGLAVDWDDCVRYGRSVGDWPAFPDSADALRSLKERYRLFVLSNVDHASFARSRERLDIEFDGVYTAEDVGSYKPDDRNFQYLLERLGELGIEASEVLHTAESMFHDHAPANRAGLASCHIYRRVDQDGFGATMRPEAMPRFDLQFPTMAAFAAACADA